MATINLAPGAQYLTVVRRRRRALFAVTAAIIVVVLLVGAVLFWMERRATEGLALAMGQLQTLETKIAELGPEVSRVTLFEERLKALDGLLANHINWVPLLQEIERLQPGATVLTELKADSRKGQLELQGSTPNIDEVAQALASLSTSAGRATMFTSTSLTSVVRKEVTTPDSPAVSVQYTFGATADFPLTVLRPAAASR